MKKYIKIFLIFLLIVTYTLLCASCHTKSDTVEITKNYDLEFVNYQYLPHDKKNNKNKIKIAVIDSGNNNDLKNSKKGYNILENNNNVEDLNGHGTKVIYKINQLCPDATIVPIKVTNTNEITINDLIKGLEKAIDLQVDIINLSLGISYDNADLHNTINKALKNKICIIAAAGNQGNNTLNYPAAYQGVISVMARDSTNIDVGTNNKSKIKKSFSAPGVSVPVNNDVISGNSISTTYITCLIAILKLIQPSLTNEEIENVIINSSRYYTDYSYGLVDYKEAIELVI